MDWLTIIKFVILVITFVAGTLIPTLVALKKGFTARVNAESEAAKEKANADLLATAKNFIAEAEVVYNGMDKLMKPQGDSAGGVKRENVFIKLQAYALQRGYEFDAEKWGAVIDELVDFTKSVNFKKGA